MADLQPGDVFVQHPKCDDGGKRYEVLRVTPCSATCRPLARERREFAAKGEGVAFDAPGAVFQISRRAGVIVVDHVTPRVPPRKKGV